MRPGWKLTTACCWVLFMVLRGGTWEVPGFSMVPGLCAAGCLQETCDLASQASKEDSSPLPVPLCAAQGSPLGHRSPEQRCSATPLSLVLSALCPGSTKGSGCSRATVLNLSGTRDWFRGRWFFHEPGVVWGWFEHITFTVHFISITVTSTPPQIVRQALDTRGWRPLLLDGWLWKHNRTPDPSPTQPRPVSFAKDLSWPLCLRHTHAHSLFHFPAWTLSPDSSPPAPRGPGSPPHTHSSPLTCDAILHRSSHSLYY